MATLLDTIYNKFLSQIDDIELSLLDHNDLEDMLIDYLENATVEFKECKKDLSIIRPVRHVYRFDTDVEFTISALLDEYTTVVVRDEEREYIQDIDYTLTYNEDLQELFIKLLSDYSAGAIEINVHKQGYIEDDLTLEEIYIISLSMRMFWLSPKIHREENLRQMMQDRDFKQLSNANMLKALLQLQEFTRQELQKYKQRYAFNGFKGFD